MRIPYRRFGENVCESLIAECEKQPAPDSAFLKPEDLLLDHEDSLDAPPSFRYKRIVAVGSINTDITLNVDEPPLPGSTIITTSSSTTLGGKGANQAVGAAKLGREVALIGKIGNDYDSTVIYDTLKKERVLTHGLRRDSRTLTGKAYIHVMKDAESSITILPGANKLLLPEDILSREHLFEGSGYCLISTEIPVETVVQAAKTAKKHGAKTILKPAALHQLPGQLLENTDIFVPNKNEATALCPEEKTPEGQAAAFFARGCPVIIITLGKNGCYLKTADQEQYFPAASFPSVDSTGGADAFIAALAAYLTEGYELEKAIRIATCAAGFCVSRAGVLPALVDRSSLENHIKTLEPELLFPKDK